MYHIFCGYLRILIDIFISFIFEQCPRSFFFSPKYVCMRCVLLSKWTLPCKCDITKWQKQIKFIINNSLRVTKIFSECWNFCFNAMPQCYIWQPKPFIVLKQFRIAFENRSSGFPLSLSLSSSPPTISLQIWCYFGKMTRTRQIN